MIKKRIYMSKDELRTMEILTSNDYVGVIVSARRINYLDGYEVCVEFDSKQELKQFCDMYDYKISRVGRKDCLIKIES